MQRRMDLRVRPARNGRTRRSILQTQTVAPGPSGLAVGQLESGDGAFYADAPRPVPASGRNAQGGARPHRGGPRPRVARLRRGRNQLRHALASRMAGGNPLAVGGVGRGAGHQEPGRPANEGRQTAPGRCPHRADRHAGREPLVRSLVVVRFSLSGIAGHAGKYSRNSPRNWATARRTATRRCGTWCNRTSCGG